MNGYGFFDLRYIIEQWAAVGMFDVLLPLLLVFVVIFAILQQSKILGGLKGLDAVISLIIAFFVIANRYVTELFVPIFSQAGLAIIILVAMALIMGLFLTKQETPRTFKIVMVILGIGLFLWLLGRMAETFGIWTLPIQTFVWTNMPLIMMAILVAVVLIPVLLTPGGDKAAAKIPD